MSEYEKLLHRRLEESRQEADRLKAKNRELADRIRSCQQAYEKARDNGNVLFVQNHRLQKLNESLVARCAAQSEVIARNAERRQCQEWPADMVNAKTE